LPTDFDPQLWESLARNHRFKAWLDAEQAKYSEALVMMADGEQLRVLQGRLRELRDISKLCEQASKP
jgi:hypothetical protein